MSVAATSSQITMLVKINLGLGWLAGLAAAGALEAVAVLPEQGVVTPSTVVEVPNRIHRAATEFKDSHDHPTEYLTFAGVLAQSSNIGTILAGEKVKAATMYDYFKKFGLGQTSGMGFPGEGPGLLTNYKDWSGSQRYTVLFGQGAQPLGGVPVACLRVSGDLVASPAGLALVFATSLDNLVLTHSVGLAAVSAVVLSVA